MNPDLIFQRLGRLTSEVQGLSCLHSPLLELKCIPPDSTFLCEFWGLNSDPHARQALHKWSHLLAPE